MMRTPEKITELLWLVAVAFWIVRAFGNKRTAFRQKFILVLLPWVLGLGGIIALLNFFDPDLVARALIPRTVFTETLGLALTMTGVFTAIWARLTIGRNWSGQITLKEDHALVTRGPYAFVRHPIYTAIALMLLGTALVFRDTSFFLGGGLCIALLVRKSRLEEHLMIQEFGGQYVAYRKKVRGFIPFVF